MQTELSTDSEVKPYISPLRNVGADYMRIGFGKPKMHEETFIDNFLQLLVSSLRNVQSSIIPPLAIFLSLQQIFTCICDRRIYSGKKANYTSLFSHGITDCSREEIHSDSIRDHFLRGIHFCNYSPSA